MTTIGAILAGGVGKRMGGDIPKQFLLVNNIPIIVYTIKIFLTTPEFDLIYIVIHQSWKKYLIDILQNYQIDSERLRIIDGGEERINSIENLVTAVSSNKNSSDDIIVIHEAVRPFVSQEILVNSIHAAEKYGAVVAAVPATDTMLFIEGNNSVSSIPDRSKIYHGQAPDSFKVGLLKSALDSLSSDEKKIITGTSQICLLRGIPIHTIKGDSKNFKITTLSDLMIAEAIMQNEVLR